jgi:histidine triad (HIT) family protein
VDCIFCQIAAGKIPSELLYEDEELVAFRDINPQAPTHLLIVPRKHIPSSAELDTADLPLIGRMVTVANRLAEEAGIEKTGYRLVINCGEEGGQVVPHLHLHLLGGKRLAGRLG